MKPAFTILCVAAIILAGNVARATVLTFVATNSTNNPPQAGAVFNNSGGPTDWTDHYYGTGGVIAPLFTGPSGGGFSDYGDNVSGATQTGKGPGGTYTYSYGTAGGATPNVTVSYPSGPGTIPTTVGVAGNTSVSNMPEGMYISTLNFYPQAPVAQSYFADSSVRRMITLTAAGNDIVSLESFSIDTYYDAFHRGIRYLDVVSIDTNNNETVIWSAGNTNSGVIGDPFLVAYTYNTTDFGGALTGRVLAIDFEPTPAPPFFVATAPHYFFGFTNIQFADIPEPSMLVLLGLSGVLLWRRKRKEE